MQDSKPHKRRGSQDFDLLLNSTLTLFRNESKDNAATSISELSSIQNDLVDLYFKTQQEEILARSEDDLYTVQDWSLYDDDYEQHSSDYKPSVPAKTEQNQKSNSRGHSKREEQHTDATSLKRGASVPKGKWKRQNPPADTLTSSNDGNAEDSKNMEGEALYLESSSPIAALERKLQEMRTDPLKRAALEQRIALYKSTKFLNLASLRNFSAENKDVAKYHPEHKQLTMKDSFLRHDEHISQVLANKERLNEDLMQHRLAIIHRREIQAYEDQRVAEEEWQRKQRELAQKRWMVLVAFGSRQATWIQKLQQARVDRTLQAKRIKSAIIIQRAYRAHYTRTQATRLQRRVAVVYRALRVFIFRFRVRRKNRAADTLRKFFSDIQDTTRIVKVIKRFRFCVSQAQQQWHEHAEVERVQLMVLLQQWNRVEREMEGSYYARIERERAKQAILNKSLFYEGPSSRARRGTITGSPPLLSRPRSSMSQNRGSVSNSSGTGSTTDIVEPFPRVPSYIKTQLLLETLRMKKYVYGRQLVVYYNQMATMDEVHKQRADMARLRQMLSVSGASTPEQGDALPPKPKFLLILPKEDVINLINQGVLMASKKPQQRSPAELGADIADQVATVDVDIDE